MFVQTKPQIINLNALHLAGLRYEGLNEQGEIPATWDQFMPRLEELGVDPAHWTAYGVAREIPGAAVSEKWEYLAAAEVNPENPIPEGMVAWDIPALTYAVLPAYDIPGIGPASNYFYQEWLPHSSEWELGGALMLEVYPETYSQDLMIYLHFPIKPRESHPTASQEVRSMDKNNISQIKIEKLPSMIVGSYQAISAEPEHDSSSFMRAWLAKQETDKLPVRTFGFDIDIPSAESLLGKRGYESWITVPTGTQPSDGVQIIEFPGGLYASMTLYKPFDDPFERIPSGWKFLHEWVLNNEQYQGGHHQWLEELIAHPDGDDLKLYHPVVARNPLA